MTGRWVMAFARESEAKQQSGLAPTQPVQRLLVGDQLDLDVAYGRKVLDDSLNQKHVGRSGRMMDGTSKLMEKYDSRLKELCATCSDDKLYKPALIKSILDNYRSKTLFDAKDNLNIEIFTIKKDEQYSKDQKTKIEEQFIQGIKICTEICDEISITDSKNDFKPWVKEFLSEEKLNQAVQLFGHSEMTRSLDVSIKLLVAHHLVHCVKSDSPSGVFAASVMYIFDHISQNNSKLKREAERLEQYLKDAKAKSVEDILITFIAPSIQERCKLTMQHLKHHPCSNAAQNVALIAEIVNDIIMLRKNHDEYKGDKAVKDGIALVIASGTEILTSLNNATTTNLIQIQKAITLANKAMFEPTQTLGEQLERLSTSLPGKSPSWLKLKAGLRFLGAAVAIVVGLALSLPTFGTSAIIGTVVGGLLLAEGVRYVVQNKPKKLAHAISFLGKGVRHSTIHSADTKLHDDKHAPTETSSAARP